MPNFAPVKTLRIIPLAGPIIPAIRPKRATPEETQWLPNYNARTQLTGSQSYSVYVAGISSSSKEVDASKALIVFLTSPRVKQALSANGFETP